MDNIESIKRKLIAAKSIKDNNYEVWTHLVSLRDAWANNRDDSHMNFIQYLFGSTSIDSNGKTVFKTNSMIIPKNYVQLQMFGLILPLIVLYIFPRPLLENCSQTTKNISNVFLVALVIMAVIQSTVWDNFGCHLGIWVFDQNNMLGKLPGLFIPLEEYFWMMNDTLLTYVFTLRLWTEFTGRGKPIIQKHSTLYRDVGVGVLMSASILGMLFLIFGESRFAFMGITMTFFLPVIAWQYYEGYEIFLSYPKIWISSWLVPGLWTYVLDCIAVNQGIWVFDYDYTTRKLITPFDPCRYACFF